MERESEKLLCSRCPFDRRCLRPLPESFSFRDLDEELTYSLYECPRHFVQTHALPLGEPLFWLMQFDAGRMPWDGGLLDQPAVFVETIALLDALLRDSRAQAAAAQQRHLERAWPNPTGGR